MEEIAAGVAAPVRLVENVKGRTTVCIDGAIADVKQPELRVIYIYAGKSRKADIRACLWEICKDKGWLLVMEEIDVVRDPKAHDTMKTDNWDSIKLRIVTRRMFIVVVTPPCESWTRVLYANSWGPHPVRSVEHPWGFPWLSENDKLRAEAGNVFIRQTLEIFHLVAKHELILLSEFPEDLGATKDGDQPASIFQLPEFWDALDAARGVSGAFYQCKDGAPYAKPTRISSTSVGVVKELYMGPPQFDSARWYKGPLPAHCGHNHAGLVKKGPRDSFKTKELDTAAYRPLTCKWMARVLVEEVDERGGPDRIGNWDPLSVVDAKQVLAEEGNHLPVLQRRALLAEHDTSDEDETWGKKAPRGSGLNGFGPPLTIRRSGRKLPFNDGLGLCSPGRWRPGKRRTTPSKLIWSIRSEILNAISRHIKDPTKAVCLLATGKVKSLSEVIPEALVCEARKALARAADQWWDTKQVGSVPERQPFCLFNLAGFLREAGDPDWRVLIEGKYNFVDGLPLGYKEPLPRTPAVYERKVKHRKYDETEEILWKKNYKTVDGKEVVLEKQFEEDEELGMMVKVPTAEAKAEYPGDRLRVAALGSLEKGDGAFRVLHDGTHGVALNNEIIQRDQVHQPGLSEERVIQFDQQREENQGVHFVLKGDASKAHRRWKTVRKDWGLQACSLDPAYIWLNAVGTFGVAVAGYWWSRIAGCVGRGVTYLMFNQYFWQLLFADDFKWNVSGQVKFFNMLLAAVTMLAWGMPLAPKKFLGGISVDWVGYWVDYKRFTAGLSEGRTQWLQKWLADQLEVKTVVIRDFAEGLGRLSFAAHALERIRPFLAPLYSWTSAIHPSTALAKPLFVNLMLKWILRKISMPGGTSIPTANECVDSLEAFRADAKAEDMHAAVGGWDSSNGQDTQAACWFALDVTAKTAPWAFVKGEPFKTIASLELLATLLSVVFLVPTGTSRSALIKVSGLSDNKGNSYVCKKLLTTKFPLMILLMELSEQLELRHLWLDLHWVPRDQNDEADALSNMEFKDFDKAKRVEVDLKEVKWILLEEFMEYGLEFQRHMEEMKQQTKEPISTQISWEPPRKQKKRMPTERLRFTDPW